MLRGTTRFSRKPASASIKALANNDANRSALPIRQTAPEPVDQISLHRLAPTAGSLGSYLPSFIHLCVLLCSNLADFLKNVKVLIRLGGGLCNIAHPIQNQAGTVGNKVTVSRVETPESTSAGIQAAFDAAKMSVPCGLQ